MKVRASRLRDKRVVTTAGLVLGEVYDILVDEKNGDVVAFLVDPTDEAKRILRPEKDGLLVVPSHTFVSVGDVLVIDHNSYLTHMHKLGKVVSNVL
ncbi:PRC-barrel domain-containing protein [Pyrococcus kukulkanii]|uniref:PRC-barrel domain-containing protein n=1 Tax=Pyrococcus kukulkanii TaxID=1609559 RepID=A0ABV4T8Y3_9EURY